MNIHCNTLYVNIHSSCVRGTLDNQRIKSPLLRKFSRKKIRAILERSSLVVSSEISSGPSTLYVTRAVSHNPFPPCGRNIYFPSYFHVISLLTKRYVKKKKKPRCRADSRASNRVKKKKKKWKEKNQEKRSDKWSGNFQQPDCRSSHQKDSLK